MMNTANHIMKFIIILLVVKCIELRYIND